MKNIIMITANEKLIVYKNSVRKTPTEGCYSAKGLYCTRENGKWQPDFEVTAFFAGNKPQRDNCICWEQGKLEMAYYYMETYIDEYMFQSGAA